MKKILILDANSAQALALSKYIKEYSNYYIVGCIEENTRFNKRFYDEVIIKKYDAIEIGDYHYILPTGANSTYRMVNKYQNFSYENDIEFDISNLIAFDKLKILEIAKSLNVPIPRTYHAKDEIEKFPIFFKEDFEQGGGTRGIAYDKSSIPKGNLLYQEYIDTPSTYGVGFLAINGVIKTFTIYKEVLSVPKEGGSAIVIEEFNDEKLLDYTSKLIKELNYNGWGLAEFKYCNKRDDYLLMEINAKFWASIEFMLNNNPIFLKLLLGMDYEKYYIKRMLFSNRLLRYSLKDIVKNFHYIFSSSLKKEYSFFYQIARKLTPIKIIDFVKKVIK